MIRIDTSKIEKWEEIKRRHGEWCRIQIKENITFLNDFLVESYKEEKSFYELMEKKLDEIILSDKLNDIIKSFNTEYTKIKKKSISIDVEFCNAGINILNNKENIKKHTIEDTIKKYITKYKPNSFIDDLEEKFLKIKIGNKENEKLRNEIKKELEEIKKYLSNFDGRLKLIFNYNKFTDEKPPKWGRREFLNLLGLETCPYCQRAYVTNFQDDEKKNTTADLDHFYPKAKYPYLALSLYNFVPSCKFCNSTGRKGDADTYKEPHIYPYTDSMEEDIKFTIKIDSAVQNLFVENKNLEIDINVNNFITEDKRERIENSLRTFKIREVYKNSHSKYVGDLIYNFQKYPKSYTKALGEIFLDKDEEDKIYQEKLQILNDNFQEIIKKTYTDRIEKGEPLAKLTKDIMEELGIK